MQKKIIILVLFFFMLFSSLSFAKDPMRWACADYPPAYYKTDKGDVKGYLYDIALEALDKRMGIPVVISFYPWKRCQMLLKQGKSDMIFTIPTPERLQYVLSHEKPAWIKRRILYTYSGHPKIEEIHKLRGLKDIKKGGYSIVSYLGAGWIKSNVEKGAGIPVRYANKIDRMYKMLAQKRGDLIIEQASLVVPNIRELKLTDKIVETRGIGAESGYHILIGKKSEYSDILPQLNKVIEKMWQDGTIEKILTEYDQ